ncbi:hypothetical protein HJFPF1_05266 [Paramyrothecium foliicola]|nr:hypothetical protein HJFPF1_05266 [Paramyrothecium foliicola]
MSIPFVPDVQGSEAPTQPLDMASFARSFKPSPFLSPRCRPALPGRTLSNSSDLSLASHHSARSEDVGEAVTSAPNTPGFPGFEDRASSQGDGYFPLHEDPKARVHRPHPFYQDSKLARHRSITLAAESSPMHDTHDSLHPPATAAVVDGNMPVASYYPAGFHDTPLPMGKYYPSNYEHRNKSRQGSQASMPEPAWSTKSPEPQDSTHLSPSPPRKVTEAERRRKMLQYQRDMVAQATLALGSSSKANSGPNFLLKGMPGKDFRFPTPATHKPHSPKLAPLGSPGPVTPMELESGGGGYWDKGRGQELRSPSHISALGTS